MLSSARRGAIALRSFRCLPAVVSRSAIVQPLRSQTVTSIFASNSTPIRSFSSVPRRFQEAVRAQEGSQDAPQEFTKFQELADAEVIHPNVIQTITSEMNIHTMTEVQRMTLNQCLHGDDVIAQARTGTGKTLAFLLPIIQRIIRGNPKLAERRSLRDRPEVDIRGLIISPTRELAEQIAVEAKRLVANTGVRVATAVGGTQKEYHLRTMQQRGAHLIVGTPGRVNDILGDPRAGVSMENIDAFVLDEADRLLDIGFAPAIEEIQSYMPDRKARPRQTLMFSATVPKSVVNLVRQTMRPDFKFVRTVDPDEAPTHERVPQKVVYLQGLQNQSPAILEIAMNAIEAHKRDPANNLPFKAIVYFGSTNEVTMAYEIFQNLRDPGARGGFSPHPLSPTQMYRMNGKLDQRVRTRESEAFRKAESAILFSSDVTARGMDFPNVSHVIQIGLPRHADDYVHRLGRTGRAGKPGEGWLLLNKDERRAFQRKMDHPGLKLDDHELATASLDMTQAAQLPANVAKMMQLIELGVKSVPYSVKSSVYASLLGVLPQQFPDRQKQDQIDLMNDLARYGWGMQTPPALPSVLVRKLGYDRCQGIEYEAGGREERPSRGFGRGRDQPQRRGFNDRDPFGMGQGGKGVFGSESSARDDDGGFRGGRGMDNDRRGGFGDRRGGFGDRRGSDDRRGGFGRRERAF